MMSFGNGRRRALVALLPLLSILIAMAPQPVQAAGGIAMSGTFYAQDFEIPQGVEVSNESIYVVVFNESDSGFTVHLTATTPEEVELSLSEQDFPLQPGEQIKIYIGVRVGEDAVPGEYKLRVTAEGRPSGSEQGIQIATAVAQEASLKVTGEAAWIDVRVVSPSRAPVVAEVRLFKETQGTLHEFASSQTGTLETKVSLGHYIVYAYVGGKKLAEESIDMTAANERKEVILVVKTVYFANFGFVRNYYTESGELAFVKVVYQISNLYQPMADVEIILKVSLDGAALEEIPLLSLSELSLGETSGSWNYTPPQGWEKGGTYTLQAELYVGGKLYTTSLEEELEVTAPPAALMVRWTVLGGIIGTVLIIIAVIVLVILVRRRRVLRSLGRR